MSNLFDGTANDPVGDLKGLLTILADAGTYDSAQRIRAVTQLAEHLQKHAEEPACILALLERVRQDEDLPLIIHCIGVLGRLKVFSAVSILTDVALGKGITLFKSSRSTASSTSAFKQTEEGIRLRCAGVQALGRMGDGRAIVPLMSLLNDPNENYRLRLAAAESLGKLGDQSALPPLINILSDEKEKSLYLKESAAKALGMLGDIRALEPLIDVLESKRGIRDKFNFLKEQIILSIGRIGQPHKKATHSLVLALTDDSAPIRLAATEALAQLEDKESIPDLKPLLLDPEDDVAMAAVSALAHLGGEALVKELLKQESLPQFVRDELESYIP